VRLRGAVLPDIVLVPVIELRLQPIRLRSILLVLLVLGELHLVLPGGRGAAELDEGGVVAVAVRGVGLGKEGDDGPTGASATTPVANVVRPSSSYSCISSIYPGRDRLHARALSLPQAAPAEHEQRHYVRRAHSESFQSLGNSAEADEGGEVAVLVGSDELAYEDHDNGTLVGLDGAVQGSDAVRLFFWRAGHGGGDGPGA